MTRVKYTGLGTSWQARRVVVRSVVVSGDLVMEPCPIEVGADSSSSDIRSSATANVTGKARIIKGEDRAFLSDATAG